MFVIGRYFGQAADYRANKDNPLSLSAIGRTNRLQLSRHDALRMIKRRAKAVCLSNKICCHTFRATGITVYLDNGGTIENAQVIAAHESPRTTKIYDRTSDEIERIRI